MELVPQPMAETSDIEGMSPDIKSTSTAKKAPGAFLTISEVADELDVQQHVLRFWETKFSQVKPLKRGGGRRYYRPEDVDLLKVIHTLLYTHKYTIKGVQKLLKGQSKMQVIQNFVSNNNEISGVPVASNDSSVNPLASQVTVSGNKKTTSGLSLAQQELLKETIQDLKELRSMISAGE